MDDLISRRAALNAVDEYEWLSAVSQTVRNMTSVREIVQRLPAVQPERKKGKWTQILNADMVTHDYRCSECHRFRFHNGEMRKKYNFCPNCGADMRT